VTETILTVLKFEHRERAEILVQTALFVSLSIPVSSNFVSIVWVTTGIVIYFYFDFILFFRGKKFFIYENAKAFSGRHCIVEGSAKACPGRACIAEGCFRVQRVLAL
jgi:hypothetical protein